VGFARSRLMLSPSYANLFPGGVVAAELRAAGNVSLLAPEEASIIANAGAPIDGTRRSSRRGSFSVGSSTQRADALGHDEGVSLVDERPWAELWVVGEHGAQGSVIADAVGIEASLVNGIALADVPFVARLGSGG
jgi:hypothetical protein